MPDLNLLPAAPPPPRWVWVAGCAGAGLAVAAGAFGAHALRDSFGAGLLDAWETGARYQMYHSLALLAVACRAGYGARDRVAAVLLCAGMVLFSGSLYVLALTGVRTLGMITPLGGLCWLAAWVSLAVTWHRASPHQDSHRTLG